MKKILKLVLLSVVLSAIPTSTARAASFSMVPEALRNTHGPINSYLPLDDLKRLACTSREHKDVAYESVAKAIVIPDGVVLPPATMHTLVKYIMNAPHGDYLAAALTNASPVIVNARLTLMLACQYGRYEIAQLLIARGANVNAPDNWEGTTPLIMACRHGYLPIVELLINHGADINAANNNGTTPLMMACLYNDVPVARFLLEHGAHIEAINNNDCTPLILACWRNHFEIVWLLLDHNHDINLEAIDIDNTTALMYACRHNNLAVAELLLNRGAQATVAETLQVYTWRFLPSKRRIAAGMRTVAATAGIGAVLGAAGFAYFFSPK